VSCTFGDIVLIRFPYTDLSKDKLRPSLVLLDTGDDDILLARMTSKKPHAIHDISLNDWKAASLPMAFIVRLHKINTIVKSRIIEHVGKLSEDDQRVIRQHLQKMWEA
jgi:mRNA interferase MazF